MTLQTKAEILEVLRMPEADWRRDVLPAAKRTHVEHGGDRLTATAMLGYSNVCKNQCLYCGMRAANSAVPRYRIAPDDVLASVRAAAQLGFRRIFFVSGEDPKYGFDNLLSIVSGASGMGLWVSLACGELEREQYRALKSAGASEYVLKFEASDRDTFNRLKPTTTYEKRLQGAQWVKEAGLELASGNIVDFPGQGLSQLADDILLMRSLGISWAPVIPYLPVKGTPLAAEGGFGSRVLNLKEISILRLMMPTVNLTAQQPGENPADGLASADGNLAALAAGANMLFADLLPTAQARAFSVVDNRITLGLEHIREMARLSGMTLSFGP